MAQHTSRQRSHLLTCQAYLDAMKSQGIENSITRQAIDPAAFAKPRKTDQLDGVEKRKTTQKLLDFPRAVRIQALALAEASISYDRIREITGIDAKLLEKMRKTARERGYDGAKSMQMKEDYVADLHGYRSNATGYFAWMTSPACTLTVSLSRRSSTAYLFSGTATL